MSWFIDGKNKAQRDAFTEDMYQRELFNFFLKVGEKRRIMFLDDAAVGVMEANVKVGPKQFESYVIGSESSVLMQKNKNVTRGYREYYTILDLTPYTDKKGVVKKYSRKPLKVPKNIAGILEDRRIKAGGSLVGCTFEVMRTTAQEAACGNDWQLTGKVAPANFPKDVQPFDFKKELKPKTEQFLEGVIKRASGYVEGNDPDPFSSAVPFDNGSMPMAADAPPFGSGGSIGGSEFSAPSFDPSEEIPF